MREITGIILPRLAILLSKINLNLQILMLQNLARSSLIHRLGLSINQELQDGGPIGRDKRDRGLLRDDSLGTRVSSSAENTAPICVPAVQCGLDEWRAGNGGGDGAGGFLGGGVDDADGHEFGGSLAVTDNEFGEVLGEAGHCGSELLVAFAVLGDFGASGGAVGEDGNSVVGGHVSVDGDGVEGAVGGEGEDGFKGGWGNGGIGGHEAEEGGHVGVDHSGSFGHAGNAEGAAVEGKGL